jgi:Mg-chelatase subunit ChlI
MIELDRFKRALDSATFEELEQWMRVVEEEPFFPKQHSRAVFDAWRARGSEGVEKAVEAFVLRKERGE